MRKLVPKVILEGTRLTHKTDLAQYDDLGAFVREQDLFRRCVRESSLPSLELDVSDGDVPRAADRVADWLEATGGLYAPEPG